MAEKSESPLTLDNATPSPYEEMFSLRYTDNDDEYVKTLNAPTEPPPCVENWFSRPKKSFDWSRNPRDNSRNRGNEDFGGRDRHGYNDSRQHSGYDRQYQGGNGERRDYGEPRNKYFRGGGGRGYRY